MEHIVYVVDDDDAVRQSVIGLLESAGLNAIGFSSAEAFLQYRFEDLPSCVILDMQMPAISGFEVADALKERQRAGNTDHLSHRPRHHPDVGARHQRWRVRIPHQARRI